MKPETSRAAPAGPDTPEIAPGLAADLPGIVEIYNDSAANSIANFDTQPTSVAERDGWFAQFSPAGPHRLLVARRGPLVVGYASSQPYRAHPAFAETVEVSIALRPGSRGQGVGSALYGDLFGSLAREPVHVALAGIALPNDASVALHRKFGFTEVGTFREYAVKDGRYLSSVWMQRLMRPDLAGPSRRASTQVSTTIRAPGAAVYQACLDPDALARWRVPDNMDAHVLAFEPRVGGAFRMSLVYKDTEPSPGGKTSAGTDTFQGRFVELVPGEKIVEVVEFESEDPAFAGEMTLTTSFADTGEATEITVRCENIPPGVRPEDNEEGTRQSLRKLAALFTA
jgi:phosphinothricin acetyltransferase